MSGLRDVLAAHEWTWRAVTPQRLVLVCSCGDEFIPPTSSAVATLDDHRRHLTAAVLDWLRARLASDEVRETVARSIHGNTIGDPAKGEPLVRVDRRTDDIIRDADAALTAVLAALEVER